MTEDIGRLLHLQVDPFGNDVEILERNVNSRKVRVKWDWGNFKSTEGFPVDDNLINWVIGQEQALKECFLCLDEWVHKLKWLEETQWYESWSDPDKPKLSVKTVISPGPYLLLLGYYSANVPLGATVSAIAESIVMQATSIIHSIGLHEGKPNSSTLFSGRMFG
jgi:hypothetical protein